MVAADAPAAALAGRDPLELQQHVVTALPLLAGGGEAVHPAVHVHGPQQRDGHDDAALVQTTHTHNKRRTGDLSDRLVLCSRSISLIKMCCVRGLQNLTDQLPHIHATDILLFFYYMLHEVLNSFVLQGTCNFLKFYFLCLNLDTIPICLS